MYGGVLFSLFNNLVVAFSSFVMEIPAKLKKAIETMDKQMDMMSWQKQNCETFLP